ncbi:hypothetical protein GH714_035235 [Hevea brasiliensis]|uniref:hAT-like transposase RNase-H fold domain-containing protein n=1 Tax=Hevea brasiliensis TaxID=3981 RepID=A0A6A6L5M3_HEVBR|nr:hypothetical protein GH714_035235 [Hevea brasiliensis]
MDDATTNVDEANQNKEKDVIEANEEEANPFASKKKKQTSRNFKYDHAKIIEVFAHMILVHELPFLFTEYELFNWLMRIATPYYQKISRATVRKDCLSTYDIEKKKVKDLLKHVDKNLQKHTLNFCDVPPSHKGVVICDVLQKCLAEWEIEDKVWTVSVDNATYNDAAIRMLKDNLAYKNSLALNGKLFHVRCCAHILNLLVQDGLSEIEDIVFNVHESVTHLAKAKSRHLIFSEIAFKEAYFGLWHKVECNIFHAIYCIGV